MLCCHKRKNSEFLNKIFDVCLLMFQIFSHTFVFFHTLLIVFILSPVLNNILPCYISGKDKTKQKYE